MIKLTSKKMEEIVKDSTGQETDYLGVFVDDNFVAEQPVKHAFAVWPNNKLKILSVPEKQIVASLN